MTTVKHRLGGAVLAIPYGYVLVETGHPLLAICCLAGTVAIAGLPDVDRFVPRVPPNGETHSVWFALLVGTVLGASGHSLAGSVELYAGAAGSVGRVTPSGLAILGFMIGLQAVLGHVAADYLTGTDVRPLRPFVSAGGSIDVYRFVDPRENEGTYVVGTLVLVAIVTAVVMTLL